MLQDATFWVALAFVIFVVLSYRKLSSLITGALDQRGERIRQELEEAQRLREEAEAEKILAYAREEAARVLQYAEEHVQTAVKRREAQAVDRINQAEASALAEVRGVAADIAISASRRLFEERVGKGEPDPMIERNIKELGGLLN